MSGGLTGAKKIIFDNVFLPYRYDLPDYVLYNTEQNGSWFTSKEYINDGKNTFNKTFIKYSNFNCENIHFG